MTLRLILAVISTLLEETALVVVVLWGLPLIGIHLPLAGLIVLMAAWLAITVILYRLGSKALRKGPMPGLPDMIGSKGKAVCPLVPEGMVRIKGELWRAKLADGEVDTGAEVTVVGQDGLKLIVHRIDGTL